MEKMTCSACIRPAKFATYREKGGMLFKWSECERHAQMSDLSFFRAVRRHGNKEHWCIICQEWTSDVYKDGGCKTCWNQTMTAQEKKDSQAKS